MCFFFNRHPVRRHARPEVTNLRIHPFTTFYNYQPEGPPKKSKRHVLMYSYDFFRCRTTPNHSMGSGMSTGRPEWGVWTRGFHMRDPFGCCSESSSSSGYQQESMVRIAISFEVLCRGKTCQGLKSVKSTRTTSSAFVSMYFCLFLSSWEAQGPHLTLSGRCSDGQPTNWSWSSDVANCVWVPLYISQMHQSANLLQK